MSTHNNPGAALQSLVEQIDRAGLRAPIGLLLDLISPLDVISSQMALMARPLVGGTSWDAYAAALAETASWRELRRLMAR